jgi:hypothetical protein
VRIITADCAPSPGADIAGVRLTRCGEGRGEPSLGAGRNHRPRHRASAALSPRHSTTKTSGYGCRRPLRMSLCRSRRCVRRFRLSLHTARTCGRRRTCGWYRPSLRLVRAHPLTATGARPSHIGGGPKWARPSHICSGTGLGAATSTVPHGSSRIRLHRDHTVPTGATSALGLRSPLGCTAMLKPTPACFGNDCSHLCRSFGAFFAKSRCSCRSDGSGQYRCRCGRGEPSHGADVAGVSPVPVQIGPGELSPGADVGGAVPIRGADVARGRKTEIARDMVSAFWRHVCETQV